MSYQGYDKQEEPDIDEEVVSPYLDDVDQKGYDGHADRHGDEKLLHLILGKEAWGLKSKHLMN